MSETAVEITERRPARGGLVGPVALIAAGGVLLLNNLGVLDWSVWGALLRLWPVLLIAIGLDLMVGRRSALVSLLIGLLAVAALAGGVWYLGVRPGAAAQTETVAYGLDGATRASVDLSLNAGELRLGAMAEPEGLIAGTVPLAPGERLEREHALRGGEARVRLRAAGAPPVNFGQSMPDALWDLRLSRDLPIQLRIATGAGRAAIDLARLQVTSLDLSAGVGALELTLPERGRLRATVSAGVGETVVRIPAGMAARIHISGGLGEADVDPRFVRDGEYYTSADYATAVDRVDLEISSGVGRVAVESLPER
ncbi:MAG TPA: DUF5668 domain-containing protein [Roseiflexaceae bacterium]|nr:DUF5668 domain-containing protein [Roseiflexaceae bacterium]